MGTVTVRHLNDDRFCIAIRDHQVVVDQPIADGGSDTAPTPTELFVASLASCVAHYVRRFLARHELPARGLEVTADYELARQPARVDTITVRIGLPKGLPGDRLDALLAVASHCTVHNTLTSQPVVSIVLDPVPAFAVGPAAL